MKFKGPAKKKAVLLFVFAILSLGLIVQTPARNSDAIIADPFSDNRILAVNNLINRLSTPHFLTPTQKATEIDNFLAEQAAYGFPIAHDNEICFVYRGAAQAVFIEGDFLYWKQSLPLKQAPDTDFFYLLASLESDARIEYIFQVNETNPTYIRDPLNLFSIPNGNSLYYYGINASEFFMPDYVDDGSWRFNMTLGTLLPIPEFVCTTQSNFTRTVHIYLPPGYDPNGTKRYRTVYVADGSTYVFWCRAVNVLDYLSYNGIMDLIAVFVDPIVINGIEYRTADYMGPDCSQDHFTFVSPSTGELVTSPGHIGICRQKYVEFITTELVPYIDGNYLTVNQPEARAHIGFSLGGYISTYVAFTHPNVFKLVGAHSGSFWVDQFMLDCFKIGPRVEGLRFYINAGTFEHVILNCSKDFAEILEYWQYPGKFRVFHQGHSYGKVRSTLSEMLTFLFTDEESNYSGSPALSIDQESHSTGITNTSKTSDTQKTSYPTIIELFAISLLIFVLASIKPKQQ
ncbi:MAG: alpha/beta hydrolase-fold protein [Candidatus Thorarchaeota archaeon]